MARPPLPIGTWGEISTWAVRTDAKGKAVKHKAQASFRDHDGHLNWPQTRVELIETGRITVDHQLVQTLVATYGIDLDHRHALRTQVHDATQPAESDKLAWIRSHALRKTTATALGQAGHTARQIADQLGQAKVSITQDIYLGRLSANPAAAQALERVFDEPEMP
ncbi:hypothetical protein ABZX12_26475 [Kribbella sp. NPDC003505]|uniref:hypothetical protein n=1 Tax=Kribbella sp. NPDC003505 TaxID=3154448 RepID=UPI0033A06240